MPNVLSKWVEKKLALPKSDETPEQLPFLPPVRPRVLTPSPSRESLVQSAEAATSHSAFFQKLPVEIRRKILKEAFGMFAMHMHLSLEYPRVPLKDRTPQDSRRHASIPHVPNTSEAQKPPKRFGIPKQKTWQWFGCICHRSWPSVLSQWQPYWAGWYSPDMDKCVMGGSCECGEWPGEAPGKCFIGAMGWLLSCRQSYAEGIDVLYSTNRIHMSNQFMVLHLPQLILPQRLASITSVELIWNVAPRKTDVPIPPDSWGLPDLHTLMNMVVSSLTGLQYLSLILDCDIDPKGRIEQDEQNPTISNPFDDFVRRLRPRLMGCDIAIPSLFFDERKQRSEPTEKVWDVSRRQDDKRLWRELPHADDGEHEKLPMNQRGYWVSSGRYFNLGLVCMGF